MHSVRSAEAETTIATGEMRIRHVQARLYGNLAQVGAADVFAPMHADYPNQIICDLIPLAARIVALADVYDAL